MEELHDIARAHHRGGPREIKEAAEEFFDALDTNGDEEVDYDEFMTFMVEGGGYPEELCDSLFDVLDGEENGALRFREVRTLYYAIKSGRPFCDSCDQFIPGAFFTCVTCFQRRGDTYDLCHACYRDGQWDHDHRDGVRFLDNYSMLQVARDLMISTKQAYKNYQQGGPMPGAMVPYSPSPSSGQPYYYLSHGPKNPRHSSRHPSSSKPLIRESTMKKMKSALGALDTAVSVANIGTALCTIM